MTTTTTTSIMTTDLQYFNVDAVPPLCVVVLSCSRRWANLSTWRQVSL